MKRITLGIVAAALSVVAWCGTAAAATAPLAGQIVPLNSHVLANGTTKITYAPVGGGGFTCYAGPQAVTEYPANSATPLAIVDHDLVDCSRPLLVTDRLDILRYEVAMGADDCNAWGAPTLFGFMTSCSVTYVCHVPAPGVGIPWAGEDFVSLYWNNATPTGVSNLPNGFLGPFDDPRCV